MVGKNGSFNMIYKGCGWGFDLERTEAKDDERGDAERKVWVD